jgi:hypothetical protein
MSRSVPTADELNEAHLHAMSKLCTEIPNKYGAPGGTTWDDRNKVCRITERGCEARVTNPISQPMFTASGEYRTFSDDDRTFGEFWKKNPPGFYAWKATAKSGGRKVCARSNFLLWQWCEIPRSRAEKHEPGITNTPRFEYNIRNGKEECYIPKEYCDSKGMSYNATERDCYVPTSQKIAEFFSGSVLVRSRRASDKKLKNNIRLLKKDFPVKGINVYTYEWNYVALTSYGLYGNDVGFIADELDPKYIYYDDLGYKHINTDIDDELMQKISAFLDIKDKLKNIIL